jgi:hypothetical protein
MLDTHRLGSLEAGRRVSGFRWLDEKGSVFKIQGFRLLFLNCGAANKVPFFAFALSWMGKGCDIFFYYL